MREIELQGKGVGWWKERQKRKKKKWSESVELV